MIIPSNLIKTGYTVGGVFVKASDNTNYIGYYYTLNNSYYEGQSYDPNASLLLSGSQQNTFLNNAGTFTYAVLTGLAPQDIEAPSTTTVLFPIIDFPNIPAPDIRYFYQDTTKLPTILIREINEDTYNNLQSYPLYKTTYIGNGQTLDQAETQIPGITDWISSGITSTY